jgi:malate dehydrogenase (quinone)
MSSIEECDVVLIGAGIMSATLGTLLRKLEPSWRIEAFERLDRAAAESSDAWNNAGTGHAGYCELNYTPAGGDGNVDCSKAVKIAAQFGLSLELWRYLIASGDLPETPSFLRQVPHFSFVQGEGDVAYLRARAKQLATSSLFRDIEYTEDRGHIADWIPLVMEGRDDERPVAATRMNRGTDVNFGALTRSMFEAMSAQPGAALHLNHEVVDVKRDGDGWRVDVRELETGPEVERDRLSRARGRDRSLRARFVFIGAGGYSLQLLEKSGIPEAKGYGAFPVSGQWLRCTNKDVIARHHAKVYGQAEVGAPPMSVPHLDTRWIGDQQELLFGPYAGFTTKFLKRGSWLDLLGSIGIHNMRAVLSAGLENFDLTRYLVGQAMLSEEERVSLLRKFCPMARDEDWEVQVAGLRVQIIKSDGEGGGDLKFGTEVVTSGDGTIAALLGASPGASTAVAIMIELLQRCFPERWSTTTWRERLAVVLPSLA